MTPEDLRTGFGRFMTGVTVVTARDGSGAPVGFTANSFTSVSLDPPLLLVCPGRFLSSFAAFERCSHFAVNVLAEGQEDVSNTFAGYKGDRFARVPHWINADGVPVIDGAVAQFSCRTEQVIPAGDHIILVGHVTNIAQRDAPGLGYVGGRYFSLGLERDTGAAGFCGAIIERDGHVLMQTTAQGMQPVLVEDAAPGAQRARLADGLAALGITAEIDQVYSAFAQRGTGRRFTYYLARTAQQTVPDGMVWVPISALPTHAFASAPVGQMMTRFALEARTGTFALYLGDAEAGDIHTLS